MTHTLTFTEQDVISAQRLHATPTRFLSASFLTLASGGVVVAYALRLLSVGATIGALIGMFGWLTVLFFAIIPYRSRRIYRQQKSLHQEHQFEWDDQFVYFHSNDIAGKVRWADFTKVKENRNMLLLYYSDTLFNMIPKRCFSNRENFEDFKAHLSSIKKG
jgi:hypothetical protein